MNNLRPDIPRYAFTLAEAAIACGSSEAAIKRVIAAGGLPKRYIKTKPVLLADDLKDWLHSLPFEPDGSES